MKSTTSSLPLPADLMLPVLKVVGELDGLQKKREIIDRVLQDLKFTRGQLSITHPLRTMPIIVERIVFAIAYCKRVGALVAAPGHTYELSLLGLEILCLDTDQAIETLEKLRSNNDETPNKPSSAEGSISEQVNLLLSGTPYSFPQGENNDQACNGLLELCRSIQTRQEKILATFEQQTQEVRSRIELMVGTTFVFESNELERAGLPLDMTRRIIRESSDRLDRLAIEFAKEAVERDQHLVEVLGLNAARTFAEQMASEFARDDRPFTESDLRTLHALICKGEPFAGVYKEQPVGIAGKQESLDNKINDIIAGNSTEETVDSHSDAVSLSPAEVSLQMGQLVDWINQSDASPPLIATVAHTWLTHIHPFTDGNGRVARLLANLVLMRSSWPPLIIANTDRLEYLEALSHSDTGSDLLPTFSLFVKSINTIIRKFENPGLADDLFQADLDRNPAQRFELWQNMVSNFFDEVRKVIYRDNSITLRRIFIPRISTLLQLERGESAGKNWLAKVSDLKHERDCVLWLGYSTEEMGLHRHSPSIFFAPRNVRADAVHSYHNNFRFCPYDIKEVAIVPELHQNSYFVRRNGGIVDQMDLNSAAKEVGESLLKFYDLTGNE
jgi:Fic family protein